MAQVPWRPVWQQPVSEEEAAALLQRCIARMQKSAAASFVFPSTFTKSYNKKRPTGSKGISDGDNDFKGVAAGTGFAAEDGRLLQQSEVYRQLQVAAAALERQPQAQLLHVLGQHAVATAAGGKGATEGQEEQQHHQQQKRTRTASPREHSSAAAGKEEESTDLRRSVLHVVKARGMLQLLPRHLGNVASGVHLYLLRFLFRYVPEFHGVWLAFDNVKIIQPRTAGTGGAAAAAAAEKEEKEKDAAEAAAPAGCISKREGATGRRNNIATTAGTTAAATAAPASRTAAGAASGMGYVVPDTSTGGGLLLFEVELDCLVFIPKQNAMLIGRVLTVRPTHLRLLWLDVFSVVVEQQGIPPSYVYNKTDRVYVHRKGGPPIRSGEPICFKLLRSLKDLKFHYASYTYLGDDSDEDVLCLAGSLASRAGEIIPVLQQLKNKSSSSSALQLRGNRKQHLDEKEEHHGSSRSSRKKHRDQEKKSSKSKHQQQVQQEKDLNEEDEKENNSTGSSSSSGGIKKTEAAAAEEMNREADGGRGGRPAGLKAEAKKEKGEGDKEKHKEKKKKGEEGREHEQEKKEEKDEEEQEKGEEEEKKKHKREKAKNVVEDVKKEKQKGDIRPVEETTGGVVGGTEDEKEKKRKKQADSQKDKDGREEKIRKKRKGKKNTSASASAEEDEGIPETREKKKHNRGDQ